MATWAVVLQPAWGSAQSSRLCALTELGRTGSASLPDWCPQEGAGSVTRPPEAPKATTTPPAGHHTQGVRTNEAVTQASPESHGRRCGRHGTGLAFTGHAGHGSSLQADGWAAARVLARIHSGSRVSLRPGPWEGAPSLNHWTAQKSLN